MSQPVIGVTLDSEEPGGYSKLPWYALRQNYCEAVARAGGLPILLPHEPAQAEAYLERIDGLVVTGGAFDVDPALFGAATRHATVKLKTKRTAFEIEIAKGALARNMPVLGICGGQQLLNVVLGGTLIQHIPDEVSGALAHERATHRRSRRDHREEAVAAGPGELGAGAHRQHDEGALLFAAGPFDRDVDDGAERDRAGPRKGGETAVEEGRELLQLVLHLSLIHI